MAVSTRIYAGGALAFGGKPAIDDLKAAGYDTVIVWTIHVHPTGDLYLNDTLIVSQGVYAEQEPMNLPVHLADLRQSGKVSILFSVGPGAWANIQTLMGTGVPTSGNVLYDNFQALKKAMVTAGGDIDGIDFDNENTIGTDLMVNFGQMLANIGYASVTLCPYSPPVDSSWGQSNPSEDPTTQIWIDTLQQLDTNVHAGFVSAIHLQCYSGGSENTNDGYVAQWIDLINAAMGPDFDGASLMIPGLATLANTANSSWWDSKASSQGPCVKQRPGVAQYGEGDWSGYLMKVSGTTPDAAMQIAQDNGAVTFFFYCNRNVALRGQNFAPGDAVFFTGAPRWGSASMCDGYYLDCNCSGFLNSGKAASGCPSDLEAQYKAWKTAKHTPGGGFIWMYDHILTCLTSGCCGGTAEHPTTTARAYRDAIANGLS